MAMPSSPDHSAVDSDAETLECDPASGPDAAPEAGETLLLEDDLLYAETQVVDDWAETQVVDDWTETQVVTDEDEDGETEVLSDRDEDGIGVVDDGNSVSAEVCGGGEKQDLTPASAGEERSAGSARKSFSAVRTASLRASGQAAICRTSSCSPSDRRCILPKNELKEEHGVDNDGEHGIEYGKDCVLMDGALNTMSLHDGAVADGHLNDEIIKSDSFIQNEREGLIHRNTNGVARSLFQEDTPIKIDEPQKKPGDNGKGDPCQEEYGFPIAGLSYICSQEPGEMSQAHAIEVVDKLLFLNDLVSPEVACMGKTNEATLPLAGETGVQCLAKVAHRSPKGNKFVYEWNDAYEDEGGGDFFVKARSSFFHKDVSTKKPQSLPPKFKHSHQETRNRSIDNGKEKVDMNAKIFSKTKSLDFPTSDQQGCFSTRGGKHMFQTPQMEKRKNILKDAQKSMSGDPMIDLGKTIIDNGIDANAFHDVGPDTQMAAEAMETLICAAPEEFDPGKANYSAGALTEHLVPSTDIKKNRSKLSTLSKKRSSLVAGSDGSEFCIFRKKRSSVVLGSDTIVRRSKRLGMSGGNINSETEEKLEKNLDKTMQIHKSASSIVNEHMNGKFVSMQELLSRNSMHKRKLLKGSSLSRRDKIKSSGKNETSEKRTKIVQCKTITPNTNKTKRMNLTPISHRTRQSIAAKNEKAISFPDVHIGKVPGSEKAAHASTKRINSAESVANQSRYVTCSDTCQNRNLSNQHNNAEVPHQEKGSVLASVPAHPKRRRTCLTTDVISARETSLLKNNQTMYNGNNSVVELGNDGSERSMPSISGLTTVPSSHSNILNVVPQQSRAEESTKEIPACSSSPFIAGDDQKILEGFDRPSCHTNSASNLEMTRFLILDVPPKGNDHTPNAIDGSAIKNVIKGSPICGSHSPFSTMSKEASKLSVARELIRLVSSEGAQTRILKDSQAKDLSSICVLFSRHLEEKVVTHLGKIAKRLGISVATSISDATHFVTDKFVRTRNLLETMAVGKPVVTPSWLKKCGQVNSFVDEKKYILRDLQKEKEIGFNMAASLACSSQNPLLQGKRIFLTPNVKPDRKTVSSLTKAAGGQPLERIGRSAMNDDKILDDLLVISCEEDYAACIAFLEKGLKVFSSELILNGIVIQKLEYERHRLFLDHVKQTRSTIWLKNEASEKFHPVAKRK